MLVRFANALPLRYIASASLGSLTLTRAIALARSQRRKVCLHLFIGSYIVYKKLYCIQEVILLIINLLVNNKLICIQEVILYTGNLFIDRKLYC